MCVWGVLCVLCVSLCVGVVCVCVCVCVGVVCMCLWGVCVFQRVLSLCLCLSVCLSVCLYLSLCLFGKCSERGTCSCSVIQTLQT